MTLPNTSFFQVGQGQGPLVFPQGAAADYTAAATLATTDLTGGIVTYAGAGANLTLPLAADLDTALPNFPVNGSIDFSVIATGAGTATLVTNTGWTIVGRLTTATSTASKYRARKTADGAWTLYLVG